MTDELFAFYAGATFMFFPAFLIGWWARRPVSGQVREALAGWWTRAVSRVNAWMREP